MSLGMANVSLRENLGYAGLAFVHMENADEGEVAF